MKILHISAECYPIAKVGGLADVVGALPKYQNSKTVLSQVIIPFYNNKFTKDNKFSEEFKATLKLGDTELEYKILSLDNNSLGFDLFLVDVPELLFKDYVYSDDDTNRFLAFQIAALDWVLTLKEKPDYIHCHDHHTGLIPFMTQESYKYESLNKILGILTLGEGFEISIHFKSF